MPSNSQRQPHEFAMPWECMSTTSVLGSYLVARLYLVVEVFLGLREVPVSVFDSVNWSSILPHV